MTDCQQRFTEARDAMRQLVTGAQTVEVDVEARRLGGKERTPTWTSETSVRPGLFLVPTQSVGTRKNPLPSIFRYELHIRDFVPAPCRAGTNPTLRRCFPGAWKRVIEVPPPVPELPARVPKVPERVPKASALVPRTRERVPRGPEPMPGRRKNAPNILSNKRIV
uniref:Uncharacterized protein n=1 Tax=Candidatus Kentrum sp. DK TaxID=2126562 RepID=A0A450TR69_9GAMM|nr:MAG: hypothetical protein BECKDK2373B_GA0170837_12892 [Candidatus Kentron sp. DK]